MSHPHSSPVGSRPSAHSWRIPRRGRAVVACAGFGAAVLLAFMCRLPARAADPLPAPASPYAAWTHGPSTDPSFFPVGVWLQDPSRAAKYKAAGFNLYVGLWKGPTEAQLAALKAAEMRVICGQNAVGLAHKDDPTIAGWLLPDEPDNAQPVKDPKTGKETYGPPVKPEEVVRRYEQAKAADPTRPVLQNLGQGVANDQWYGRGSGAKKDDYLTYVKAADIVSFDVYPVAGVDRPPGHDNLWLIPRGIRRLTEWTGGRKIIWAYAECTHISDPDHKATPEQVRCEVWLGLASGAKGIMYFVHDFKPKFNEHALLDDPEMLKAVTAINRQVHDLAPVLNAPTVEPGATVTSADKDAPVLAITKRHGGATYVFAVNGWGKAMKAAFAVPGLAGAATAEPIDEDRKVAVADGKFQDEFGPWQVHLYRIR